MSLTTVCASESAARAVGAALEPVTVIRINGVCPTARRRPAGTPAWDEATLPRSLERRIPLTSLALWSALSEWMISLTVLGFVARLGTDAPPFGVNGWPR